VAVIKRTIKRHLAQIREAYPKRDLSTGQLYRVAANLRKKNDKIVLWGLFVSDEGTFMVRPHIFEADKPKTGAGWDAWFSEHYGKILRDNILPGMEKRTGKQWRLYRVIGWTAGDNTKLNNTAARKTRNKTKPKRRQNGRNSTRRR